MWPVISRRTAHCRRAAVFAAQSNLAFLGMWITSSRPDLAGFLPFDADAGSHNGEIQHAYGPFSCPFHVILGD